MHTIYKVQTCSAWTFLRAARHTPSTLHEYTVYNPNWNREQGLAVEDYSWEGWKTMSGCQEWIQLSIILSVLIILKKRKWLLAINHMSTKWHFVSNLFVTNSGCENGSASKNMTNEILVLKAHKKHIFAHSTYGLIKNKTKNNNTCAGQSRPCWLCFVAGQWEIRDATGKHMMQVKDRHVDRTEWSSREEWVLSCFRNVSLFIFLTSW